MRFDCSQPLSCLRSAESSNLGLQMTETRLLYLQGFVEEDPEQFESHTSWGYSHHAH